MPPVFGLTQAGYVPKPLSAVQNDLQQAVWSTINPQLDLSPNTPDGQMLGIHSSVYASLYALLGAVYNQFNRQDCEGAAADNVGDLTGTPRAGATFTQVLATLTFSGGAGPYSPGQLVANVAGQPSQTYSNLFAITAAQITAGAGTLTGVIMQSTTVGQTPAVAPTTLTAITSPVTGWLTVSNPAGQSQLGTNAELDANYVVRQVQQLAGGGGSTAQSLTAAIEQAGAAQSPPVSLSVLVLENRSPFYNTVQGVVLPPNSFAPIIYDSQGWSSSQAGQAVLGPVLYANQPPGITLVGSTFLTVQDPLLGPQTVAFSLPAAVAIDVSMTIAIQPNAVFSQVAAAIKTALAQAAVAPTPATGIPPLGQLAPGIWVIQSQLEGVIASVPGVFDIQVLQWAIHGGTLGTAAIIINANQVATFSGGTITVNQGTYP